MRNAVVYYFSGTGNTEFVARLLVEELRASRVTVDSLPLDFVCDPVVEDYDTIFLGFPVHGFGVPVLVRDFIGRIPSGSSKNVAVFCTFGAYSAGAEKWAAQLLAARGLTPIALCGMAMPHNNPAGVNTANQPIEKLVGRARDSIRSLVERLTRAGSSSAGIDMCSPGRVLLSSWLNPLSIDRRLVDFAYADLAYADGTCNRCGHCVTLCPTGSISISDGEVCFEAGRCASCLRCFSNCPKLAIQTGPKTLGAPRYRGPRGDHKYPVNPAAVSGVLS